MPLRVIPRRTATNIRTMTSNWLGHNANPRKKYMRLAKLEFEKAHYAKQRQRAEERAEDYQFRLDEIAVEDAYLVASVGAAWKGEPMPSKIPSKPKPATPRRGGGPDFVLRY